MSEKIEVVRSPSGHCLVVNDIRVFGGKIHGVGAVIHRFDVDSHLLLKAINPEYRAAISACHNIPTATLEAGVVGKMVEYFKLIKQLHEFCSNHNFDNDKHLNENCDKLDGLNGRIRDAKQEIMKLLEESK
jgi:hypothetical protein